jgi:hypothetical protein
MSVRGNLRLLTELGLFLRYSKRWWLAPILVMIVLLSLLIVLAHTVPAFYPLLYPFM